jgi:hypothetical protein
MYLFYIRHDHLIYFNAASTTTTAGGGEKAISSLHPPLETRFSHIVSLAGFCRAVVFLMGWVLASVTKKWPIFAR